MGYVILEAQFVDKVDYPKRNPKSLRNFLEQVNWDEGPCPPNCRVNHDEKWYGVTIPYPSKEEVKVAIPAHERLEGQPDVTKKDLEKHRNLFGDCPELYEVAEVYGIEFKRQKGQVAA